VRKIDLTGVFKRDDGAIFRLVRDGPRVIGYRADSSAQGTRVALEVAGDRVCGKAISTKRSDETALVEAAWDLKIGADGTLAGSFEVAGPARLERTAGLDEDDVNALFLAAKAHIDCDRCLAANDVQGAS